VDQFRPATMGWNVRFRWSPSATEIAARMSPAGPRCGIAGAMGFCSRLKSANPRRLAGATSPNGRPGPVYDKPTFRPLGFCTPSSMAGANRLATISHR
jgi:hypothetical protein